MMRRKILFLGFFEVEGMNAMNWIDRHPIKRFGFQITRQTEKKSLNCHGNERTIACMRHNISYANWSMQMSNQSI